MGKSTGNLREIDYLRKVPFKGTKRERKGYLQGGSPEFSKRALGFRV